MKIMALVIVLAVLSASCGYSGLIKDECKLDQAKINNPRIEFREQLTVAEADHWYLKKVKEYENSNLAAKWKQFQDGLDSSSCIYVIDSGGQSWESLSGFSGLAVVYQGVVIDVFLAKRS